MFGLAFRFPAGRYHATPWGRNVNEADVAWPPEPWRILRALIACYWRKGDRERWSEDDLARLVDALAADLPVFRLPVGAIHAHTRHYMPIRKGRSESSTLVFDAFLHLPDGAEVQVIWRDVALDGNLLELARDLASGMGYLGRAESWTDCRVILEADGEPNCGPSEGGFAGESFRLLVPRSARSYRAVRERLMSEEGDRIQAAAKKPITVRALRGRVVKSFRTKSVDTLPTRLVDAIAVDTADLQNRKWNRPPAAYEAIYARDPATNPGVVSRSLGRRRIRRAGSVKNQPTVARYLLAGRPRPRIEDAVKIGEVMRAAALSKFGWDTDDVSGKRVPRAPWQVTGRDEQGRPLRDPAHSHAFWLPEDADEDGWIDHVTVFVADGMDHSVRSRLDRITRLWITARARDRAGEKPKIDEWRLALEGFGSREDFAGASRLLATSRRWRSVTPLLAAGHLKKAGYEGEVHRLLRRRGIATEGVAVEELRDIDVGGVARRALNFHRFRTRGRERQTDTRGALLEITFPEDVRGPLALGYASHFGLGAFGGVGDANTTGGR